jgi:hypothetical protein
VRDWKAWLAAQGIEVKEGIYIPYQREWQREKKAKGLCVHCGKNPIHPESKSRCIGCLIKQRETSKRYTRKHGLIKGNRPNHRGGRKPITDG